MYKWQLPVMLKNHLKFRLQKRRFGKKILYKINKTVKFFMVDTSHRKSSNFF